MSIKTEINRIRGNVAAAYSAAAAKGAEMPADMNSDNLAATIASISAGGGVIETEVVNHTLHFTAQSNPTLTFNSSGAGTGFFQFDVPQSDVDMLRDIANNLITGEVNMVLRPRTSGGTVNIPGRLGPRVINNVTELMFYFDVGGSTYGLSNNRFLGLFSIRLSNGTNYVTAVLQGFGGTTETYNASPNIEFDITAVKFKSEATAALSEGAEPRVIHRRVINESN